MNVSFIATTLEKLNTVPIVNGQIIALSDANQWYYDMGGSRRLVSGQITVESLPATGEEGIWYISNKPSEKGIHVWNGSKFEHISGPGVKVSGGGEIFNDIENNTAEGENGHAEGTGTAASSANQHVQGKYNIEDSDETYAHIVGNGTSDTARSNAHTVDWNGNGWFAGDVVVGPAGEQISLRSIKSDLDELKEQGTGSGESSTLTWTEV